MANHKSAKKCIRKIARKTLINQSRLSKVRTAVKKFEALVRSSASGIEELKKAFIRAESALMRGCSNGVLHKNTASRKTSRLSKILKSRIAA